MSSSGSVDLSKYNPLKEFRTYSYYHVLLLTGSTDFVQEINSAHVPADFYLHPDLKSNNAEKIERYTAQTFNGKHKYVLLANTATDANVIINDVVINNLLGGSALGSDPFAPSSIFMDELKMTITESFGSRFVEYFLRGCTSLNINQGQAILLFKTIFVGHRSNGEIEVITKYNALPFMIVDMSFNFSHSGTTYHINGVSLDNGFASLPMNSSVRDINTISTKTGTYKEFIEAFNDMLAKHRDADQAKDPNKKLPHRKIVIATGENSKEALAEAPGLAKPYSDSDYTIQIQDSWKSDNPNGGTVSFSTLNTIHDILHHVNGMCPKMKKEMEPTFNDNDLYTIVYIPKITNTMTQGEEDGKTVATFTYTITKQYQTVFRNDAALKKWKEQQLGDSLAALRTKDPTATEATVKEKQEAAFKEGQQKFYNKQKAANNLMEYDYIFSGKNEDLINMNMVFDFGVGAFYSEMTPDQPVNQKAQTKLSTTAVSSHTGTNGANGGGGMSPPTKTSTTPMRDPNSYNDFQLFLRRYSYFETLAAEIEILGNPRFVARSASADKPGSAADTTSSSVPKGLYDPKANTEQAARDAAYDRAMAGSAVNSGLRQTTPDSVGNDTIKFKYSETAPFFVKINVFMPRVNATTGQVEFGSEDYLSEPEKGFQHPFWYDGLFTVQEITSSFESGKFTQKLTLLQIVTDGSTVKNYTVQGDTQTEEQKTKDGKDGKNGDPAEKTAPNIEVKDKRDENITHNDNVRAFLRTIRVCEGTYTKGASSNLSEEGFDAIVNGYTVPSPSENVNYKTEWESNQRAEKAGIITTTKKYSGSRKFTSYTTHPRYFVLAMDQAKYDTLLGKTGPDGVVVYPEKIKATSAAGAYQITATTWDQYCKDLGSFTPDNQTQCAIRLLKERKVYDDVAKGNISKVLSTAGIKQEWDCFRTTKPDSVIAVYEKNGGKVTKA